MEHSVCPWYLGYLLASPLRRLFQNPEGIVGPHLRPGDRVLEVGPGMGFFSIPMARIVGAAGRVYCVDLQPEMLASLQRRARRAGVGATVEVRRCGIDSLGIGDLTGTIDFVLLFAVVHEVPDHMNLLSQVAASLKSGGRVLIAEPAGHVQPAAFAATVQCADAAGLRAAGGPDIPKSLTVLLEKP